MNPQASADFARTLFPRSIFQNFPVQFSPVDHTVMDLLAAYECIYDRLKIYAARIIRSQKLKALLLKRSGYLLIDLARSDTPQQFWIGLNLWNTNRGVRSRWSVVVFLVILECLSQGRGAIETNRPIRAKCLNIFTTGDAEQVEACLGKSDLTRLLYPRVRAAERLDGLGGQCLVVRAGKLHRNLQAIAGMSTILNPQNERGALSTRKGLQVAEYCASDDGGFRIRVRDRAWDHAHQ